MNLTTEFMKRYVGGQVEIIGEGSDILGKYRYRGQVKDIQINPDPEGHPRLPGQEATLRVEFDYVCKLQEDMGYTPDSEGSPFYELSLGISAVKEIGRGPFVSKGPPRLCVECPVLGEMTIFFPPEHNKRVLADGTMEQDEE